MPTTLTPVDARRVHVFTNGDVWTDSVLVIRDAWDCPRGYRLYWAESPDSDSCVQVDGEIDGRLYRRVGDARFDAERRFPGVPIHRWL